MTKIDSLRHTTHTAPTVKGGEKRHKRFHLFILMKGFLWLILMYSKAVT